MDALRDSSKAGSELSPSRTQPIPRTPTPQPTKPAVGTTYKLRAELPSAPLGYEPAFAQQASEMLATGNETYTHELKEQGHLGLYLERSKTTPAPITVNINPPNFFLGIKNTLAGSLRRLFRLKTELGTIDLADRVEHAAEALATGCVLSAYNKVRAIVLTDLTDHYSAMSLRRAKAARDLPIPAPFAFAIQQLGAVNVADLETDTRIIPCFPERDHNFGLPAGHPWNPNAYAQAVEYARSLGMRFAVVDPKVKNGSAWWLLEQHFAEDVFELRCVIPEINYTEAMAITHTLFLTDEAINPSRTVVNLSTLAGKNYGTMLRNPHPGINLSSFEAIAETASEVWSSV